MLKKFVYWEGICLKKRNNVKLWTFYMYFSLDMNIIGIAIFAILFSLQLKVDHKKKKIEILILLR